MRQLVTTGIILARTDFGEADRIITMLTPDHGKLKLMAKGVRRSRSKLAGGIELFSVSTVTFIRGRGDIGTLISTRLLAHFSNVVRDLDRTMLGYELIKLLDKMTEDEPDSEYFELMRQAFQALDDAAIDVQLIALWFHMQLLSVAGHSPNLATDTAGSKLDASNRYAFSFESMAFSEKPNGVFAADHIKFLRIGFSGNPPVVLQKISGVERLVNDLSPLIKTMLNQYAKL